MKNNNYKLDICKQIRKKYPNKNLVDNYELSEHALCDLVELDPDNKPISIYEIKTLSSIKFNINTIIGRLQIYDNLLKAKGLNNVQIILAYKENNVLVEKTLNELLGQNKNEQEKGNKATSLIGFLTILKNFKFDNANDLMCFYRGHSDKDYSLQPGIYRNPGWINHEKELYHDAARKRPLEFTEDMSTFDKLVKMQHYELPTRLLDITSNPLVALYFACTGNIEKDGEVILFSVLSDEVKYYDSHSVSIISNLVNCQNNFNFDNEKDYLVHAIQQEFNNFDGTILSKEATNEVICVLPKMNNERIIRQFGAFFIFGINGSKDKCAEFKDKPISIVIDKNSKGKILQELRMLGINEAYLFPEINKTMEEIKNEYKS